MTSFWVVFLGSIGLFVWLVVSHDADLVEAQAAAGMEVASGGERWAMLATQIVDFVVIAAVGSVMAWRARFAWFGYIAAIPVVIGLAAFLAGFLGHDFAAARAALGEVPLYWSQVILVLLPATTMVLARPLHLQFGLRRATWGAIAGGALLVALVYELGMHVLDRDAIQQVPTALFLAGALYGATRRPTRVLWAVPAVVAVQLLLMLPGLTLGNAMIVVTMWTFAAACALAGRSLYTIERGVRRRLDRAARVRRLPRSRTW